MPATGHAAENRGKPALIGDEVTRIVSLKCCRSGILGPTGPDQLVELREPTRSGGTLGATSVNLTVYCQQISFQ